MLAVRKFKSNPGREVKREPIELKRENKRKEKLEAGMFLRPSEECVSSRE